MIRVGDPLPSCELDALHDGGVRRLDPADRDGRWLVLLTYEADFAFIDPTELAAFAERSAEFELLGADLMSVSTDTVLTHKAWRDSSPLVAQVEFPMLADPSGAFCRALGVYVEDEGAALRGTFVIDPDGTLQALEVHANAIGRDAGESLRRLHAAHHVREAGGDLCPAGWRPGDAALAPSLALVGRL